MKAVKKQLFSQPDKADASITKLSGSGAMEVILGSGIFKEATEEINSEMTTALNKLREHPEYESAIIALTIKLAVSRETTQIGNDKVTVFKPEMAYKTKLAIQEVEKTEGKLEGAYILEDINGVPTFRLSPTPLEAMAEESEFEDEKEDA